MHEISKSFAKLRAVVKGEVAVGYAADRNSCLRRLMDDRVSIEAVFEAIMRNHDQRRGGAPQATVEALAFTLRKRGPAALTEPPTGQRLRAISEQQLREVCKRMRWPDSDTARLVEQWAKDHG